MNEKVTSYGGGIVLSGTEVWNRDPLPKPPPPKVYTYKLTMTNTSNQTCYATANSTEELCNFDYQLRNLGYEFIKLERLEEE